MSQPLSADARALVDRPNFAHLATLMADGSPQSVPVWLGREGDRRADPDLAIMDPISHKYIGTPFPMRGAEGRVALVIEIHKARYTKLPFTHTPAR